MDIQSQPTMQQTSLTIPRFLRSGKWTSLEEARLKQAVELYTDNQNTKDWMKSILMGFSSFYLFLVADHVGTRTSEQSRQHWLFLEDKDKKKQIGKSNTIIQ